MAQSTNDAFPTFGMKEWEAQIGSEIATGTAREEKSARVSEVCRMYRANKATRSQLRA
jgi:hypothetical protein